MKNAVKFFILSVLAASSAAFAKSNSTSSSSGILFEVVKSGLLPAEQVGDSVFYYVPKDLECDPSADEEEPCLAKVDHWQTVCYKGDMEKVCSAFDKLFAQSSDSLLHSGAEEDVEMLSCGTDTGIVTLSYNLISGHGGPNVQVKDKLVPMCPIFVK